MPYIAELKVAADCQRQNVINDEMFLSVMIDFLYGTR